MSGELKIGTTYLHLEKKSPYLIQHHRNWRLMSSLKSSELSDEEIMYTAPMVISKELAKEVQEKTLNYIQELVKSTKGCKDEEVWNFNIDFIKLK